MASSNEALSIDLAALQHEIPSCTRIATVTCQELLQPGDHTSTVLGATSATLFDSPSGSYGKQMQVPKADLPSGSLT